MENILNLLNSFAVSIGVGNVASLVVLGLLLVGMLAVSYALVQVGRHEWFKRLAVAWDMIDDHIASIVVSIAYGQVDLSAQEKEAERLEAEENYHIDPRMLYIVQQIQLAAKQRYGLTLDLVEIHQRAESIFQHLKAGGKVQV